MFEAPYSDHLFLNVRKSASNRLIFWAAIVANPSSTHEPGSAQLRQAPPSRACIDETGPLCIARTTPCKRVSGGALVDHLRINVSTAATNYSLDKACGLPSVSGACPS